MSKKVDPERRALGEKMFEAVYGGVVPIPPKERQDEFFDFTIENLFSEVWSRDSLSIRDRRLVAMGIMAALGEDGTFEIQLKAAISKGELNKQQIKDLMVFLTQYVGFPRATRMLPAAWRAYDAIDKA